MAVPQLHAMIRHLRRLADPAGAGLTDAQLLERFAAHRDEAAFEVLLWRHGPMVWNVCRRVLPRPADAEDAFQATFLALVRQAGSVNRREAVGGWLHKAAYHVALKARESAARGAACEKRGAAPSAADLTDELLWRDSRPVLDEEVNRLPERYRAPFVLCCLEGLTNAEAARQLGCPKGTVLSRLAWARQRLRARLARRGVTHSAATLAALLARAAAASPTLVGSRDGRTRCSGHQRRCDPGNKAPRKRHSPSPGKRLSLDFENLMRDRRIPTCCSCDVVFPAGQRPLVPRGDSPSRFGLLRRPADQPYSSPSSGP